MSSSRPIVSIVIPVWNHANEIMACLRSIDAQTYRPLEVTIVDDGSTDHLFDLMANLRLTVPHRFIQLGGNHGASAARNAGVKDLIGEYLLFVDADIVLHPDAIEKMVLALEHSNVTFAYSSFRVGWKKFRNYPFDAEKLRKRPYIHTTSLMRRTAFTGFDESLKKFQDWDLWLTIVERGGTGVWIDEELFEITVSKQRESFQLSKWFPRFVYSLPWWLIGWMPKNLKKYRYWEKIVKEKHGISS
ncbi:MAG: glycosyltransferase family A protein [Patescibacteria group bacterium]